jgi:hypothetical protein
MSNYSERLSITLSADLAEIAAKIGRALDPDVGGESSFVTSEDGLTISTSTPCTPEFKAQSEYLLANPEALHAAVSADYLARWGDMTPPTLAECQAFCAGVVRGAE